MTMPGAPGPGLSFARAYRGSSSNPAGIHAARVRHSKVAKRWDNVKVDGHAAEVLTAVGELGQAWHGPAQVFTTSRIHRQTCDHGRRMLKVELHAHTADDPVDRIPHSTRDLIDRAAALGFDALAVTLHNQQLDPQPWQPYAAERNIVLIPGVERTIEGKHVLLLNFERGTDDVRTFDDLASLKRRSPGLIVAPHPYYPASTSLWGDLDRHVQLFDAVERNAMFTRSVDFNLRAERWARARGKPIVGNGDIHRLRQLGTTYSLVDADRNPEAICQAIAAGRVQVVSEPLEWTTVAAVLSSLIVGGRHRGRRAGAASRPSVETLSTDPAATASNYP